MTINIYCDKGRRHVVTITSDSAYNAIVAAMHYLPLHYTWKVN